MKIKEGFEIRNVCGENIIIAHGKENIDFTKVITLNESAVLLWNKAVGKDFTEEDLVNVLLDEYDVEVPRAAEDVKNLVTLWVEAGLVNK
ncbi:MAG: PqqD family protein [Bacteroidaceae bacterium]|jgi:hypothetical protein|nr:PqqD family protein [Bacteroidaceae bacterium]